VLNEILKLNKAKIVLTSSWRKVFNFEKQCEIFKENGVIQVPYNQTDDLGYENRSDEIRNYLIKNKNISDFLILDDMEIHEFDEIFIRVDYNTGLTIKYLDKAHHILNREIH
jgi:hypothetical protein